MRINLSDKVAVVTGAAGRGLGRADALALGRAGCSVALVDVASSDQTLQQLAQEKITAKSYECDIADEKKIKIVVDQIIKDLGGAHIVVNNASILTTVGMFADIPVDLFNRDVQVNLIGSANVTRAVWPTLVKQGWGRVVFMSSIAGTRGGAGQASYAATKAGVIGLAKSLAIEGARYGVTANAIAPGIMQTDSAMQFIRDDMLERMKKSIPMRRFGKVDEIADTITFLCSPQAAYITGQVITVDGGSGLFVF